MTLDAESRLPVGSSARITRGSFAIATALPRTGRGDWQHDNGFDRARSIDGLDRRTSYRERDLRRNRRDEIPRGRRSKAEDEQRSRQWNNLLSQVCCPHPAYDIGGSTPYPGKGRKTRAELLGEFPASAMATVAFLIVALGRRANGS